MNIGWWIFTLLMGVPGGAELYAAFKLFPFIRKEGGLIPFLACLLCGVFDVSFFFIMVAVLLLDGNLVLDLPLDNPVVLFVVIFIVTSFILSRFACGVISLWFAGILDEKLVRTVTTIKLKEKRKRNRKSNKTGSKKTV
jgi:hypothetical protein